MSFALVSIWELCFLKVQPLYYKAWCVHINAVVPPLFMHRISNAFKGSDYSIRTNDCTFKILHWCDMTRWQVTWSIGMTHWQVTWTNGMTCDKLHQPMAWHLTSYMNQWHDMWQVTWSIDLTHWQGTLSIGLPWRVWTQLTRWDGTYFLTRNFKFWFFFLVNQHFDVEFKTY